MSHNLAHIADIQHATAFDEAVSLSGGEGLPILLCGDPDYDKTVVDFTEFEHVTITQIDEAGNAHVVLLSAKIIHQLTPYLELWKTELPLKP